ncbi:MAG: DinB family protein [Planctomycetota bacterium]
MATANWTELLTTEIEDAYGATAQLIGRVKDEDLDWKPETGANWMTTGRLLFHIAESCGMCFKGFVTGEWPMPEGATEGGAEPAMATAEQMKSVGSVEEARTLLAADKQVALDMLAQAGESRLAEQGTPAPWDPRELPLGQRLLQMVGHLMQHKGQLFYYLKLQGQNVNSADLWGMTPE